METPTSAPGSKEKEMEKATGNPAKDRLTLETG